MSMMATCNSLECDCNAPCTSPELDFHDPDLEHECKQVVIHENTPNCLLCCSKCESCECAVETEMWSDESNDIHSDSQVCTDLVGSWRDNTLLTQFATNKQSMSSMVLHGTCTYFPHKMS